MPKPSTKTGNSRDPDVTGKTSEIPPLATRVASLQEAVDLSLASGLNENTFFVLARALLAFYVTTGRQLSANDLLSVFALWWTKAGSVLPPGADFDEYRYVFHDTVAKTKVPLGSNPLEEAILLSKT